MNQPTNYHAHRQRIIAIVIISVVVLGLAGAGIYSFLNTNDREVVLDESNVTTDKKITLIKSRVDQAIKNGGIKAGQDILDSELAKTTNKSEQGAIYTQKSLLVGSEPGGLNRSEALRYAYKAEELNPTYSTAYVVASLEELESDTVNAVKYYKLYLERADENSKSSNPGDFETIQQRVKYLEIRVNS